MSGLCNTLPHVRPLKDSPPLKKKKNSSQEAKKKALHAAKKESLRTYKAERQVHEAEEEGLQRAIRASTTVAEGHLVEGTAAIAIDVSGEDNGRGSGQSRVGESSAVETSSSSETLSSELSPTKSSSFKGLEEYTLALVLATSKSVTSSWVAVETTVLTAKVPSEVVGSTEAKELGLVASRQDVADSAATQRHALKWRPKHWGLKGRRM